jgi:hypothetical protein
VNSDDERTMNRNYERTMNDRMIERTNDRNFGSITAGKRLFGRTNGRTIERSDERTNKLRTGGRTILVLVCACVGGGVGVWVWGGGSCHEMAWGGMRGGPCPSIYSHGGGIRGRDDRISGRMRGLVGD